jgi:predicted secreted hydrolase
MRLQTMTVPKSAAMQRSLMIFTAALVMLCSASSASQELSRAAPGYVWSFPRDHGNHPSYQTEWWYYTGQLYGQHQQPFKDAPEFGFQLTFFRRSELVAGRTVVEYMAHAALTNISERRTYFSSRVGGSSLGLATTSSDSLAAASGDWTVDPVGEQLVIRFGVMELNQSVPLEVRILTTELPPVWLQGVDGLSRKAACDGCSSMYYSIPQIALRANVGARHYLHGLAWMDHEFMTNSLANSQVGWDWFGLMFRDGASLMIFQLRNARGDIDFASASIRRGADSRALAADEFTLTPHHRWRSPATGAVYPIEWRIVIPKENIDVVVRARVEACEVGSARTSAESKKSEQQAVRYWEGPVAATDESVLGYLEMTGYAGRMAGV